MALKMKELNLSAGETLFEQGEVDARIFFLLKGEVKIFVTQNINSEKDKSFHLS